MIRRCGLLTCAIEAVCTSDHLLQNLSTNVPHVLSDLDASGLNHEHILVHCRQRKDTEDMMMMQHDANSILMYYYISQTVIPDRQIF